MDTERPSERDLGHREPRTPLCGDRRADRFGMIGRLFGAESRCFEMRARAAVCYLKQSPLLSLATISSSPWTSQVPARHPPRRVWRPAGASSTTLTVSATQASTFLPPRCRIRSTNWPRRSPLPGNKTLHVTPAGGLPCLLNYLLVPNRLAVQVAQGQVQSGTRSGQGTLLDRLGRVTMQCLLLYSVRCCDRSCRLF